MGWRAGDKLQAGEASCGCRWSLGVPRGGVTLAEEARVEWMVLAVRQASVRSKMAKAEEM